jgi:hypothetical protein
MTKIKICILFALVTMSVFTSGCSTVKDSRRQSVVVEREYPVYPEGSVEYVWEEPARDVVDVPPGLDPEGHYYRPSHQEVVESLPGRYRLYSNE